MQFFFRVLSKERQRLVSVFFIILGYVSQIPVYLNWHAICFISKRMVLINKAFERAALAINILKHNIIAINKISSNFRKQAQSQSPPYNLFRVTLTDTPSDGVDVYKYRT